MTIHSLGRDYPNSGSLKRRLAEFFTLVEDRKSAPADNEVLIAILTDIAFDSPSAFPVISQIISKLLSVEKNKETKYELWKNVKTKLSRIPNHAYLDLWLQRIIKPIDKNVKSESKEPLCRLVDGESVEIWNFSWLKDKKISKCIEKNKIITNLDHISSVIKTEEIGPVWEQKSL